MEGDNGVHDRGYGALEMKLAWERMAGFFLRRGKSGGQHRRNDCKRPDPCQELRGHLNPLSTSIGASTPGLRGENSGIVHAAPTQTRSVKLCLELNHIAKTESMVAGVAGAASYCSEHVARCLNLAAVYEPYP